MKSVAKALIRRLKPGSPPSAEMEEEMRIRGLPRRTEFATSFMGLRVVAPDNWSFIGTREEIERKRIYDFATQCGNPLILDVGANIGLGTIFFKSLYPACRVLAFEADPSIASYYKRNVESASFTNVKLIEKGVWSSSGTVAFAAEGTDAGRIVPSAGLGTQPIDVVRLRDYLTEPIALLKVDIEGAETDVLLDCQDRLGLVDRIFVEYHSFSNQKQTLGVLTNILTESGFRIHVQPVTFTSRPFLETLDHLGMDLQLNIFGTREVNSGEQRTNT